MPLFVYRAYMRRFNGAYKGALLGLKPSRLLHLIDFHRAPRLAN